ncbi:MAG TPA: hypothetical protein PLN56_01145 [Methanoregulaceae archaeon]|nr:MAG: hypothetical protein IPI71_01180 [Methanolinea sp.]HON80858.1 hypothetical protein [Methanoregulaceae archaeon]HPD09594.1 hypothetical protein [Methanoregulaceae archaeon]HRT15264.1 hypothetical protein [Methanoregulaceae archaeon]HRU30835.1 hypothetical protein [Methanoregulaceae archaeon]
MMTMNNSRKCLNVAGALFLCLLVVGTVSAYDADIACLSMREVMAGSHGVTEIELTATAPLSVSALSIRPDGIINSEYVLCTYLKSIIREAALSGRPLSKVILTLSYMKPSGVERISYELSPSTNMFIRLGGSFDPTKPSSGTSQEDPYNSFLNRFLLKKDITKSSVLANLQRIQKGGLSPVVVVQSGTGSNTGMLQKVNSAHMQKVAGYSTGQGNLASMKSELIRKYTLG